MSVIRGALPMVGPILISVLGATLISSCAHHEIKRGDLTWSQNLAPLSVKGPVTLQLKAQAGNSEEVSYKSHATTENYEGAEKRSTQDESTNFTVITQTVQSTATNLAQVVSVRNKDGGLDLHTMAMPEVGERLELEITRQGEVVAAGGYPRQSIFYVPQISLPPGPVSVGDTWATDANWVSLDGNYPFSMEMVSILQGFYDCTLPSLDHPNLKDQCADIELSGRVIVAPELMPNLAFKNEWRGRMLFAVKSGTIFWSQVNSEEDYASENNSRKIKTVLETQLTNLLSSPNPSTIPIVAAQASPIEPPTGTAAPAASPSTPPK